MPYTLEPIVYLLKGDYAPIFFLPLPSASRGVVLLRIGGPLLGVPSVIVPLK